MTPEEMREQNEVTDEGRDYNLAYFPEQVERDDEHNRQWSMLAELCERLDRQNDVLKRIADALEELSKKQFIGEIVR